MQAVCPREVVTYTCTVTQASNLGWSAEPFISSSSPVRFVVGTHNEQATQSCGDISSVDCTDIDFRATLTSVGPGTGAADLTSTFTFTATARLNGTVVQCSGLTAGGAIMELETLNVAGGSEMTNCHGISPCLYTVETAILLVVGLHSTLHRYTKNNVT